MAELDTRVETIRGLLSELERDLSSSEEREFAKNFDALEVPDIVSQVIQFLQPQLNPYEAAIYWHMFNLAVLQSGEQICKVSTRGLMTGVVRSARGAQGEALAIQTTRGALKGLEDFGAIIRVGEPTKDGTPYRVLLPEELPQCRKLMELAQTSAEPKPIHEKDLDYYNIQENRLKIFERDGYLCKYCRKQLTRFTATLDHIQPVSEGGENTSENLVTACLHCNSRRGSRPVEDFLDERDRDDA